MILPVFITARLGSTRLPRKHLLPLGAHTVIECIVRRCEHFGFKPYLCVPDTEREAFAAETTCLDVFAGDAVNVEARLIECAHAYGLKTFHHLDGDDPYFDADAVIDSYNSLFPTKLGRVRPSSQSQAGSGRVGTSYNLDGKDERNLMDRLERAPWPQRLTLDYPEDYHLILAVDRMCGSYMAPRWAIDELFVRNPDLHKVNWFRTAEWKERQRHEQR